MGQVGQVSPIVTKTKRAPWMASKMTPGRMGVGQVGPWDRYPSIPPLPLPLPLPGPPSNQRPRIGRDRHWAEAGATTSYSVIGLSGSPELQAQLVKAEA